MGGESGGRKAGKEAVWARVLKKKKKGIQEFIQVQSVRSWTLLAFCEVPCVICSMKGGRSSPPVLSLLPKGEAEARPSVGKRLMEVSEFLVCL